MSNVSTSHNVMILDKGSKALTDQRLARVIAKRSKTGEYESENLTESRCVSLPMMSAEFTQAQVSALTPHILGMLADAQDKIIRERIIEGATSINDAEISTDACIKYLDDAAKGNRVTGEYVTKWFAETYSDPAAEFIAAMLKWGSDLSGMSEEQLKVIEQKVNTLASMFAGFASGKYSPDIPKCKAMIKFGEFLTTENQDARMVNFIGKAKTIKAAKEAELSSDALGF